MALVFNGTTIPETGTIKWGTNNVTEVKVGSTSVWKKLYLSTQTLGDHTWYDHVGSPENTTDQWNIDWVSTLTYTGRINRVYFGAITQQAQYVIDASTNGSSWTRIKDAFNHKNASWYTISNTSSWKYIRIGAKGATKVVWEDPAGNYYWKQAFGVKVEQYHY